MGLFRRAILCKDNHDRRTERFLFENNGKSFLPGRDSFGSVAFATVSSLLVFADCTPIMFVFLELDTRFLKMKLPHDTINKPICFQDMSVGSDLKFLRIVVITNSSAWQGIAVQIIEIGILLLHFRPQFVMLARVSPHTTGRFNHRNRGCLGDDSPFD